MLEHSSAISAGLSVAAVVTTATGFGAPVGIGLAAAATTLSGVSAVQNIRNENYLNAGIDLVSFVPGAGSLGARVLERSFRQGALKGGATTRREIRDTIRPYERFRDRSDNISATLLTGSGASGGVSKLC